MKKFLPILISILVFVVLQKSIGTVSPWPRLLLLAIIPGIFYLRKYRGFLTESVTNPLNEKILVGLFVALCLFRVGGVGRKLYKKEVKVEDIATVYVKSIDILFKDKKNPYDSDIDPYPFDAGNGKKYFAPKYTSLQMFLYAPWTLWLKEKGIYIGNFFPYFGMLLLVMIILSRESKGLACLGGILFLSTDYIFNKSFSKGTNDFWPTFFLMISLLTMMRNQNKRSGLWLGLSFLCKQLPAGFFGLAFLVSKKHKAFFWSIPVVLIGMLPFCFGHWQIIYDNLFEFNLIRPARETSLMLLVSPVVARALFLASIVTFLAMAFKLRWESWDTAFIGVCILIIFSKMSPGNYFVWCFPPSILWYLYDPLAQKRGS